jgi:hypothetical protein
MQIGYIPPRGIAVLAKFLSENGYTPTVVPTASIVNDAFIQYANDFDHKAFIEQAKAMK